MAMHELPNSVGDLAMMRFQREVTSVVEVYFGVRVVAPERLSPGRQKERVVLSPDRKQWRPFCTKVLLEPRVERDVAGIGSKIFYRGDTSDDVE